MHSFLLTNNPRRLLDNDGTSQKNDAVTKRHNAGFYGDDFQPFQDMNFTRISTFRATSAATSTENIYLSTERYMDVELSRDIGNATLAVSQVT